MAILNAKEFAELSLSRISRLSGFVIGTNDLMKATGAARAQIKPWLMDCVLAAKAYDLSIIDGVYNDFSDLEGLRTGVPAGPEYGDGRQKLDPSSQIECCNEIFSPSRLEIEQARMKLLICSRNPPQGMPAYCHCRGVWWNVCIMKWLLKPCALPI